MIIKYNDRIYADSYEDCYIDDDVQDVRFLLGTMANRGDIETYTRKYYAVNWYEVGSEDDIYEALGNLIGMYGRDNALVPIEVIKE